MFDALVQLPDGTSYNAYLVQGSEKTVLIDTVDPTMQDVLLNHLLKLGINQIDYVVANHAEQDHSGALPQVLTKYPEAKVITTPRGKDMLADLLMISPQRVITVDDKETLSLGDKTLEFIYTPWVHWPETMSTYLREEKILFSCDFFGSHLATNNLYVTDEWQTIEAAKRYYAEIMMPFRSNIQRNLDKLRDYMINIIAPSHGPLYDKPASIMGAYHSWVSDEPKNVVVVAYTSMHGSTHQMVEHLIGALTQRGVTVKRFDLTVTDSGKLAMALVDAASIVIGAPTILSGAHPNAIFAAFLTNLLRPKLRFVSIIGSYGWGGKTIEQLTGIMSGLKIEILEPVLCKGFPREADFIALDNLALSIAAKHQQHNFV